MSLRATLIAALMLLAQAARAEVAVRAPEYVVEWQAASGPVQGYEVFVSPDCGVTWPTVPYAKTGIAGVTPTPLTQAAIKGAWGRCWGIRVRAYATAAAITTGTVSPGAFGPSETFRVGAESLGPPGTAVPRVILECVPPQVVKAEPVAGSPSSARFVCGAP